MIASGCGGGDEGPGGLASLVPPDAPFYVEGVIRAEGDQAEAIDSFAQRVGGIDPGAELSAGLDQIFAANQVAATYAEDVEPWVGHRAAAFVSSFESSVDAGASPDFVAMVEVDDADAARGFLERVFEEDPATEEQRSYDGTDYFYSEDLGGTAVGLIDDEALGFGTEPAFKAAVDSSQGESLAESEEYTERADALPDDALGAVFFEPAGLIEAAIASNEIEPEQARMIEPLLGGPLSQTVAATLTATPETASIDVAAMVDGGAQLATESSLLDGLPAGSWLAAAVPDLGPTLERSLDQLSNSGLPGAGRIESQIRNATGLDLGQDVLGWLGDAAVFVEGTAPPAVSAGLIAETSDPEAPRALLEAVQRLAERDSGLSSSGPPEGADYGFSIGLPGIGGGAEAGVVGDMLVAVIGSTTAQALDPGETLGDDERFQAAFESLGDDLAPALYVHLPSFFDVAQQGDSDGSPDYQALAPQLDAFESLVVGSRIEDGLAVGRITVSLAPE